jgi:hypothetical protein
MSSRREFLKDISGVTTGIVAAASPLPIGQPSPPEARRRSGLGASGSEPSTAFRTSRFLISRK